MRGPVRVVKEGGCSAAGPSAARLGSADGATKRGEAPPFAHWPRRLGTLILAGGVLAAGCGSDRVPVDNPLGQSTARDTPTGRPSSTPSGTATPGASSTSSPSPSGVPSTCVYSVCIETPDGSRAISSPVKVEGDASVEGGALTIEIRQGDRNSPLLGSATTTASASAPARGTFSVAVPFTPKGDGGRVYAFSTRSPAQHSWVAVPFATS